VTCHAESLPNWNLAWTGSALYADWIVYAVNLKHLLHSTLDRPVGCRIPCPLNKADYDIHAKNIDLELENIVDPIAMNDPGIGGRNEVKSVNHLPLALFRYCLLTLM
jgi:hypothetical protein